MQSNQQSDERGAPPRLGAVVLCGGGSRRMGQDKASLAFGASQTMLERVLAILDEVVPLSRTAIVAAQEQRLPNLLPEVRVVRDRQPDAGPLPALAEGLAALAGVADAAFVTSCDAPFLKPALVTRLFELWQAAEVGDRPADAVVPRDETRLYPLAAVYRVGCWQRLAAAIAAGRRSLHSAMHSGTLIVQEVRVAALRDVDPKLESFVNCNTPEEYEAAIAQFRNGS